LEGPDKQTFSSLVETLKVRSKWQKFNSWNVFQTSKRF
jgi:hypothetical protein